MAGRPMTRNTRSLLEARWDQGLFVSVGLDPDWMRLPSVLKAGVQDADRSAKARATLDFCTAVARGSSTSWSLGTASSADW